MPVQTIVGMERISVLIIASTIIINSPITEIVKQTANIFFVFVTIYPSFHLH